MHLPTGVSFLTGTAARERRLLEHRLMAVLREAGFEEVVPPVFEYWDAADTAGDDEQVYRFPDPGTGRTLALRWDFTWQLARMAALRGAYERGGCRWCYRGSVFRAVREHAGRQRQIAQLGAEIMGEAATGSTRLLLELATAVLEAAGLGDATLVVGHAGFVERLLAALDVPETGRSAILDVLRSKDLSGWRLLAATVGLDAAREEKVGRIMLGGPAEEMLALAGELLGATGDEVIQDLAAAVASVPGERLVLDLTEARGFDYYTGLMVQGVVPSLGQEVLRGGRYDNLLARFGPPGGAVGFALDLDLLLQARSGRETCGGNDGA